MSCLLNCFCDALLTESLFQNNQTEFAGTIFAFANSIGNTAGFFVPLLAGAFVRDAYDREQWTPFWLTTAAIMGSSGLIFLVFGETRRQDYADEDAKERQDEESLAAQSNDDDDDDDEVGKQAKTKAPQPLNRLANGKLSGGRVAPLLAKVEPLVRLRESAV